MELIAVRESAHGAISAMGRLSAIRSAIGDKESRSIPPGERGSLSGRGMKEMFGLSRTRLLISCCAILAAARRY